MRPDPAGNPPSFLDGGQAIPDFESPGPLLFLPLLFIQGGGMDLSKVGERILSSVRSARSLGLLPAPTDRPEVPARAAAAAAVARALAGVPPHEKVSFRSSSEELVSVYGSKPIDDLEEDFYKEDFDPVRYILENVPPEESDATYLEKKSTLRLAQLDKIAERLSRHVMEHHEEMVKGMQLIMELEQDLKVANVICMNGRRHLSSSINEVSRDLVVNKKSRKKQVLLDMLPILTELRRSLDMQMELETLVENGKYCQAFQLLPEYLQVLDNYSELSVIQEMGRGVEAWLARTIQKLDSHLLGVCKAFKEGSYITAIDAYALMGDVVGLGEKIQSFFMQEVLSQTHSVLKDMVYEEIGNPTQTSRLTYSDLCIRIPESRFRQCLLRTLDVLFRLMCSYYCIMSFQPEEKDLVSQNPNVDLKQSSTSHDSKGTLADSVSRFPTDSSEHNECVPDSSNQMDRFAVSDNIAEKLDMVPQSFSSSITESRSEIEGTDAYVSTSESDSPFFQLRKDATAFVAHTLGKGRKNLWQLTSSRVSVLLSSSAICSTSTYQFLRNYEDLNIFILAGEAFSGAKAVEFRQKLKTTCESYLSSFHRQNVYALKMVLEKESWMKMSSDTIHVISLAGLFGDGAPLIASSLGNASMSMLESKRIGDPVDSGKHKIGFAYWLQIENPFSSKLAFGTKESPRSHLSPYGSTPLSSGEGRVAILHNDHMSSKGHLDEHMNGSSSVLEDENEDLLADFIDEDSQLPSRISKPKSSSWSSEEISAQTGSSLCLLRLMDKYARLMQKLEVVNIEFFKGMCQLFGIFYHYIFETFGQPETSPSGKSVPDVLPTRVKAALSKILQDCDQWIRNQNMSHTISSPIPMSPTFAQMEVTPTAPPNTFFGHAPNTSFGLKERCSAVETISLVAQVLHKSKAHLQSMLLQHNAAVIEDFFVNLVDSVPDLSAHIHRATARMLLHINGYADKIANAKWEVKDLGFEHNGYVDLLLGEFKHYKTRLMHGGISKEVQDVLLEYGLENVADTLIEGLSRVKRCTDEGRVLMSLDLQVLINGLQHFVTINVKPKLQIVETFIKAYYLPETEYVHWARTHPEYSKSQINGLVNLVSTMKGWKRKTRLEVLERIEAGA
ncbi:syndetin isoform X2 [Canna indica]|uniref:Syndetin isoform X2 n=1 Tax=Canna indica TaxID=4628 RepID=A0AAQ3QCQ6_9LILI|nr:syndetin isoform X2 [Canna indica]